MKKILIWMMLAVLTFTGCQKSDNTDQKESLAEGSGESENPTSQPPQEADHTLPDYVCSGTYYKLEVTPVVYDADAIMDYLLPGVDRSRAQRNEQGYYSIEIDNDTPYWGLFTRDSGFSNFGYHKSVFDFSRKLTEQEALGYSDAFIRHFGYQVADNPEFEEHDEGPCSVYYYFEYEGVPILEKGSYYLGNDQDAWGEYIDVTMDGNGIASVSLMNLYDVTSVLEEYPAEELISSSQLGEIIHFSKTSFYQQLPQDVEHDYRVNEIELIYIPAREKEKWVFLPAFRVRCASLEDGEVISEAGYMLIDALSGYVYRQ